jgi:HSP20 family molecular chaperone IbpA
MNAEKDVAPQGAQSEPADSSGSLALRPAVDIFENGDAIRLFADLPGVSEESLQLEVDDRTLTIQGDIGIEMPDGMKSLHADVRSRRYRRAFTLSNELDTARIEASLKNGLLTVTLPKREEVRPRKIEITAG